MPHREVNRITDQLERLFAENWTGFQLRDILDGIDDAMANTKLPEFNNTIHQVARHIVATDYIVLQRLQGINYQISPEEDWPPAAGLKAIPWKNTVKDLYASKAKLIALIEKLKDADLDQPILEGHSSVYVTLHGNIQHSYYHIGQIVIIKNMIDKRPQA